MKEDMRLSLLLKIVNNVFERRLNQRTADMDLTAAQCDVLGFIHRNESKKINPIDIERRFNLKRPTITGILKRLEEKDFIKIQVDMDDKRYKQILLTEKSYRVREEMFINLKEQEKVLYKGLSDEDKDNLQRILKVMLNNLVD